MDRVRVQRLYGRLRGRQVRQDHLEILLVENLLEIQPDEQRAVRQHPTQFGKRPPQRLELGCQIPPPVRAPVAVDPPPSGRKQPRLPRRNHLHRRRYGRRGARRGQEASGFGRAHDAHRGVRRPRRRQFLNVDLLAPSAHLPLPGGERQRPPHPFLDQEQSRQTGKTGGDKQHATRHSSHPNQSDTPRHRSSRPDRH
ncbi:MAG: hypothetical protein BWX48_02939 [Verrucomicrobia bacterium ADurb.Bin006]|nr:MAG: hypothetical protein BWX48_02939 [Verrucomicrobia bacterium ADurb.Bin006]